MSAVFKDEDGIEKLVIFVPHLSAVGLFGSWNSGMDKVQLADRVIGIYDHFAATERLMDALWAGDQGRFDTGLTAITESNMWPFIRELQEPPVRDILLSYAVSFGLPPERIEQLRAENSTLPLASRPWTYKP